MAAETLPHDIAAIQPRKRVLGRTEARRPDTNLLYVQPQKRCDDMMALVEGSYLFRPGI